MVTVAVVLFCIAMVLLFIDKTTSLDLKLEWQIRFLIFASLALIAINYYLKNYKPKPIETSVTEVESSE